MTDLLVPYDSVDPSGMSRKVLDVLTRSIQHEGFTQVGRFDAVEGTVFIAERFYGGEWIVRWGCRNIMQDIRCKKHSSPVNRQAVAIDAARRLVRQTGLDMGTVH